MSKIEAGRTSLNITSFDFWQTLRNIEEMTCIRTEKKGLQFTVSRASEVPQCIKTDESKLRQVLLNLLSNAVKFTEEGNVTLRVRRTEKRRREESNFQASSFKLQFEIEDTGIGIAPDEIDMIFEALERTQQSQRFTEGTGLGLAISRKFVQLMGGEIHVKSDVGKGSVFTFDIQAEAADITEIKAEQPPRQIIGLESNQPAYRILVVEDHRESRILLTQLLRSVGFEVREATNGREALAQYASWQPHLIFMDMGMPIMDGYEATRQIQKEEEQKSQEQTKNTKHQTRTPIIALTASSFEEDRVQVLAAGCDSFVRKPFKDSEIFAIMAKHLAIRYVYEESEEQQTKDHRQFGKEELKPETLSALPSDILDILEQATIQLNRKRIINAIETIRPHNKPFADNLLEFVDDFQYDEILNCLRTIREKRHDMK
jgi:two-component system sensor histidine kinase/response regulator